MTDARSEEAARAAYDEAEALAWDVRCEAETLARAAYGETLEAARAAYDEAVKHD